MNTHASQYSVIQVLLQYNGKQLRKWHMKWA